MLEPNRSVWVGSTSRMGSQVHALPESPTEAKQHPGRAAMKDVRLLIDEVRPSAPIQAMVERDHRIAYSYLGRPPAIGSR